MLPPRPCCGARLGSDRGEIGDQLDSLLGRHRLTKNRSGRLVPLARAIMKHTPLAVLTAEQEAALFAPVNTERVLRPSEMEHPIADAKSKSDINRQLDKIKKNNYNSNKKNAKPLDMRAGGLVRKSN